MTQFYPLYKASWIDRLIHWMDRLPIHIWLVYFLFYFIAVLALHISVWIDAVTPFAQINPLWLLNGIWSILPLIFIRTMGVVAVQAIDKFSELVADKIEELESFRYRFTIMPSRPVFWMATVFGFLIFLLFITDASFLYKGLSSPIAYILGRTVMIFSYSLAPIMIYQGFRQLKFVTNIYTLVAEVNIFHQQPLYVFSKMTMYAGLFWILILNLTIAGGFVADISPAEQILNYAFSVPFLLLAIITFILPLSGIHHRILEAKLNTLEKNSLQIQKAQERLYTALDNNKFDEISALNIGMNSLFKVRDQIQRIGTWPWAPGTFRIFLSAIFLPMLLWALQLVLARNFGG